MSVHVGLTGSVRGELCANGTAWCSQDQHIHLRSLYLSMGPAVFPLPLAPLVPLVVDAVPETARPAGKIGMSRRVPCQDCHCIKLWMGGRY